MNHPKIDAAKFFATILQSVWTCVLELWKACNADQTLAMVTLPPNMWFNIHDIFAAKDCLPQTNSKITFSLSPKKN